MADMAKKLIEVALPIREISAESVRDKNLHHAHIRNLGEIGDVVDYVE